MNFHDSMTEFGFVPANHSEPNFFPVDIGAVYDDKGGEISGHKRVFRKDTNETLSLQSNQYALIPYEESFGQFEQAIEDSSLDTDDMQIATDYTRGGGRVFRQYLFPGHKQTMPSDDDIALRIIMFNSYDGTSSFTGYAGWFRFVCANMSIVGDAIIKARVIHRGQGVEERIPKTIDAIVHAANYSIMSMQKAPLWEKCPVNMLEAAEIVNFLPASTPSMIEQLVGRYGMEAETDGENLWTLFNTMTQWATHIEGRSNAAQTRADREKRVWKLTESEAWRNITTPVHSELQAINTQLIGLKEAA
jgi:hypothetical protein